MDTITIHGREYTVERKETTVVEQAPHKYELTGKRGATYVTIRNAPNPTMMFLVDRKGKIALNEVWLTDKNGKLEVAR